MLDGNQEQEMGIDDKTAEIQMYLQFNSSKCITIMFFVLIAV